MLRDLMPPPVLLRARRVLSIQPHPDDTEWSAGGTVARLTAAGAEVFYVTVTDGSWGTVDPAVEPAELAALRREEQAEAARLLGVNEIAWLDFPDGNVPPGAGSELRDPLVKLIRSYRPDAVLAPDPWMPYEAHPDHYNTGLAAAAAMIFAGLAPAHREEGLEPHSPEMVAFYNTSRPNTYVPVDETWEDKIRAVEAHTSQFSGPTWDMVKFYMKIQAEELASRARSLGKAGEEVLLAEGFKVLAPLHLHCNWDAENW